MSENEVAYMGGPKLLLFLLENGGVFGEETNGVDSEEFQTRTPRKDSESSLPPPSSLPSCHMCHVPYSEVSC